jgi:hypothetical protein
VTGVTLPGTGGPVRWAAVTGGGVGIFLADVLGYTRSEGLNSPGLRWSILDEQQRELGSAQLQGRGAVAKATSYLFGVGVGSSSQLAVFDHAGTVVLGLSAAADGRVTTARVARGDGMHLGSVVHRRPGLWRAVADTFTHAPATPLELVAAADGSAIGAVHQDDNTVAEMVVRDAAGRELARLARSQRRAMQGPRPIVHHDYRLEIAPSAAGPRRDLLIAVPLVHDLLLGPDRAQSVFP